MWNYSDKVFEHFMNPRNVGEVENPDGIGEVGSMACGDALRLSFKLDGEGRIAEARFQTFGCGSAIASSSVLTEMVKGKTLAEAARITNEDIAGELDGLPREKMHCSVMGREALEAAMVDYFKKQGREVPCDLLQQSTMLCHCFQVTKETVRDAIMAHRLAEIEDVTNFTKAGGGCTDCHHDIGDLLRDCWAKIETADAAQPEAPTTDAAAAEGGLVDLAPLAPAPEVVHAPEDADEVARIRRVLRDEVMPALGADGGGIELVRFEQRRVYVLLTGACAACRKSDTTLKGLVEEKLHEFVADDLQVVEVDKR